MSDQSKSGVVVPDDLDQFSRDLTVGARDRGLGRVDYAVIQAGQPIAVMESVRREPSGDLVILPDLANARLFAAAPELYMACLAARDLFMTAPGIDAEDVRRFTRERIRQLEKALAKADGLDDGKGGPGLSGGESDR